MPARSSRSRAASGWLATMPSFRPCRAGGAAGRRSRAAAGRHRGCRSWPHPLAHALDRSRIAAAQRLDHVAVGVRREGRDRALRRLLDHAWSTRMPSRPQAEAMAPSTAISQANSRSSGPPTSNRTARYGITDRLQKLQVAGKRIGGRPSWRRPGTARVRSPSVLRRPW